MTQLQLTATIAVYFMTFTAGITQRFISPQPAELQNLCPGDEIDITCETIGSSIMVWISAEYIGSGSQLEIRSIDSVGTTIQNPANPNTFATLISASYDDGVVVLVSQLHIRVEPIIINSSVTCMNLGNASTITAWIQVVADPGIPQVTAEYAIGSCAVNISWTAPSNIAISDINLFMISFDGMNNMTNNTVLYVTYPVRGCSSHNVSVRAVNRCGREGRPSTNTTHCKRIHLKEKVRVKKTRE